MANFDLIEICWQILLPTDQRVQWDGGDGGAIVKDRHRHNGQKCSSSATLATPSGTAGDTASERLEKEKARAYDRYVHNLEHAFRHLLPKLKRAYGQPAHEAADTLGDGDGSGKLSQDIAALLATAQFLNQVAPEGGLAHFVDRFTKLAQMLRDLQNGTRVPSFAPTLANRSDQTVVWMARLRVVLAIEIMRRCGHSREKAAKWAAKKHPGLEQLITESGSHRGKSLWKTLIHWCEAFSSHKFRNEVAADVYDKLKAGLELSNCNSDQMEAEAERLLQEADPRIDEANVGIFPHPLPDKIKVPTK
jgi:hypothetical protein